MQNTNTWFIWFPDLLQVPPLQTASILELGHILLEALEKGQMEGCTIREELQADTLPRILFLSCSRKQAPAFVYRGNAFGIIPALKMAYEQFLKAWDGTHSDTLLKIDVVQNFKPLGQVTLDSTFSLQPTLEGLAFSRDSQTVFLAEQIAGHAILQQGRLDEQRLYNAIAHMPYLGAQYAKLKIQGQSLAYRFTTESVVVDNHTVLPLYRGKRVITQITPDLLHHRLELAALYLARHLTHAGRFGYSFHPDTHRFSSSYNITRHAGTTYALLEFYEIFPNNPALLDASKKALVYLKQHMLPGHTGNSLCVLEQGISKLGANALAAVAFSKYLDITQDKTYLPIVLALGEWILDKIQPNGQCKPQKEFYFKEGNSNFDQYVSLYYPGEAILGLLRIFRHDPNPKWLDAAEKIALWLITTRDKDLKDTELLHDHWLLYGLNELFRHRPNPIFMKHTERVCDSMIASQITEGRYPDWSGGFYNPPRSTPSATRAEGLFAAYHLLRDYGQDQSALDRILASLEKSILFQLRTQFLEESCMYFPDPRAAFGGFHGDLTHYEMRIDYSQHNMSGLLGLYHILKASRATEQKP